MTQQARTTRRCTLGKAERLCSFSLVDRLFQGGASRSLSAFPLRMGYMPADMPEGPSGALPPAQMMVSVPKRHFRHAVDRNRAKRQVREAYRLNKHLLYATVQQCMPRQQMLVAFIYLDSRHHTSEQIHARMANLLQRLAERIQRQAADSTHP